MSDKIVVKGARVHNLKNVSVEIPKNKLVVITGLSGSGKSSLAFDTIYAEGQRRYAESLSSYARQFMDLRDKPDVDSVEGLSPTIAIDQRVFSQNPRSTVGTTTEIYDYLRLLFSRLGEQYCPDCGVKVEAHTAGEIMEAVRKMARKSANLLVLAPLARQGEVDGGALLERVEKSGQEWVRINGELIKINALPDWRFEKGQRYDVELLIGRITDIKKQNPTKMVELALELSNGLVVVANGAGTKTFSTVGLCAECGRALPVLDMRSFSFNSPYGACPRCTGLGVTMEVDPSLVIPNDRLTLAEGAIQPWTRITGNQNWYQKILSVVAEKHKFSLDIPIKDLPAKVLHLILYGTGDEIYLADEKKITFSGVVPNLTQRHLETDSEYVRKEIEQYMHETICPACLGMRLRRESLAVKSAGKNIAEVSKMSVEDSHVFLKDVAKAVKPEVEKNKIAEPILREAIKRISSLEQVGLGYLSTDRSLNTLSGGEVTRVRLATQLSTGLLGVVYILDEPSVGLHPKDNQKLIDTLRSLRDLGNTVIVVEHDAAMMEAADYVIDVGPGAGTLGGKIVAVGNLARIKKSKESLTGAYLSGRLKVD
ncbi:MAG TPA: excinuclease ABC subunit UvrA, partial [Patescibacteria group bacterium]|nr:excinuclease ABC subunit UvrA [Patescibacteria group bacterium]